MKIITNNKKVCKVEGCNNKHLAKGYCAKHYERFRKYGDPIVVRKKNIIHTKKNSTLSKNIIGKNSFYFFISIKRA